MTDKDHEKPVEDFAEHVKIMEGFHKRIWFQTNMCHWSKMIRRMDIDIMCKGPRKERKNIL